MRTISRRIFLLVSCIGIFCFVQGQKVSVTFRVDMSQQLVSPNGVHLAGSFQSEAGYGSDWNPSSTQMTNPDADDIFEITLIIPPGTYEFKYVNGNAWGFDENPPSECSFGGTHNRQVIVGNTDMILDVVPFNLCGTLLIVSVDMKREEISPAGVHVMGNFQEIAGGPANWDPGSVEMFDSNNDSIYTIVLMVPTGQYEYLFVNGNSSEGAENVPDGCGSMSTTGKNVRIADVSDASNSVPLCYFNTCEISSPVVPAETKISLTFRVNMAQQDISANGIHVMGNFQHKAGYGDDYNPATVEMTDADNDEIFEVSLEVPPGTYEYIFVNGHIPESEENPPVECVAPYTGYRVIVTGDSNLVLPIVSYNTCNSLLNFSVDMGGQKISPDGIHLMGDFQSAAGLSENWDPGSVELEDLKKDGIYSIIIPVPPGQYQYVFVNGSLYSEKESPPAGCSGTGPDGIAVRNISTGSLPDTMPVFRFGSCETIDPRFPLNYHTYWWNDAVFYEIFVRSFYDSNNDGIGDFRGITEKLDYLNDNDPSTSSDLGINAIWLMPMMQSPGYHGYNVSDYYSTNTDYGSMEDFQELVSKAHERGIKVIIDFVMNHSSDQNPWFSSSATNQDGYRDYYVWSETQPGYPGPFGGNGWNFKNGAYFLACFGGGMPDLNYRSTALRDEMLNVANFWLGKGIDGFRLDAISLLVENGSVYAHTQETLDFLEQFNTSCKTASPSAFTVGEVWDYTTAIIPYVQEKRLDACFEFTLAYSIINGVNYRSPGEIKNTLNFVNQSYPLLQYGVFLTNHDMNRVFSQFDSDYTKMKQAASIYLTLPGIPFIYYGEELGLIGEGDDINKRRPMQWTPGTYAGFSSHSPWYGLGSNYKSNNVETMSVTEGSLLGHYKRLVQIRNKQVSLRRGYLLDVFSTDYSVLSYGRVFGNEAVIVLSNFGDISSDATFSIQASTLPAGNYYVKELYSGTQMGSVMVNSSGGISEWQSPGGDLPAGETRILLLSTSFVNSFSESSLTEATLEIYPNPANQKVDISICNSRDKECLVEVYSSTGIILYQSRFKGNSITIQTSGWPAGIYFVKTGYGDKTGVKKLVVGR